jgi:hypothetical protein
VIRIVQGVLIAAAVSTASDYVWYEVGVAHRMTAGILTGVVMLLAVGAALGWAAGRLVNGLWLGVVAGLIGALAYYALVPPLGAQTAMISAWASLWIILAVGDGRLLRASRRGWSETLVRGVLAAALSGLAFYAVSGDLWGRAPAGGRNYLLQFARWVVAWAPGIVAIALGAKAARR